MSIDTYQLPSTISSKKKHYQVLLFFEEKNYQVLIEYFI